MNGNARKRWYSCTSAAAVLLVCGFLLGCQPDLAGPAGISLSGEFDAVYDARTIRLYYRYADENYLSGETRSLQLSSSEKIETVILRELIAGPSAARSDLEALIHPRTIVLDTQAIDNTLYITFSSEFLSFPKLESQDWAEDVILQNEMERKRLATYSIINTIMELGDYQSVQILIDADNTGVGRRLNASEFGFEDEAVRDLPLNALTYNPEVSLSAQNTVNLILESIATRNWHRLYRQLAKADRHNVALPPFNTAQHTMENYSPLMHFAVREATLDVDGKGAVVFAELYDSVGATPDTIISSVPFRLVLENEVWKIGFNVLNECFLETDVDGMA